MTTTFETNILDIGGNTGIEVPAANVAELGLSKKPPVNVTVAGYTYKSTVMVMGGKFLIPLSKAHRIASGINARDLVTVLLELDEGPREVEVPEQLRAAIDDSGLYEVFTKLSSSKRKEFCRQITEAKAEATRTKRIETVLNLLKESN